jgi:hypothetical protein
MSNKLDNFLKLHTKKVYRGFLVTIVILFVIGILSSDPLHTVFCWLVTGTVGLELALVGYIKYKGWNLDAPDSEVSGSNTENKS